MGGVFMKKIMKRMLFLSVVVCSFYAGCLLSGDQAYEGRQQTAQICDTVIRSFQQALTDAADLKQAKIYLAEYLPQIKSFVTQTLSNVGVGEGREGKDGLLCEAISLEDYFINTISENGKYKIRFYFLNLLEKVENFFLGS